MKNKLKKLTQITEIPLGMLSGFYMEVFSKNEITVSADAAVTELSDTVLKIKCGEHGITFLGNNIKIEYYTSSGIKITGDFSGIEFS